MASWNHHEVTNEHLLPYVDSATAPPDVKAALNTLPFERNIFKLLANGAAPFPPFMKFLSSLWSADRKIRASDWQTAVLRTAATLDAPYEWDVNEPVARVFGFSDAQLDALRDAGKPLPEALFSQRRRLVARFVEELNAGTRLPAETMAEMRRVFSNEEIMELFYVHAAYSFIAKTCNSCQIDFDPPIPGLEDSLRRVNAATIEKEKQYTD